MSGPGPVMDGSPSSSEANTSENELTVYGQGIGGTGDLAVSTEDVRGCAAGLRSLASELRSAASRARFAALAMTSTAALSSSGAAAVDAAWQVAHDGEGRAAELDDLAARLDGAAQRYEDAEAASAAMIWRLERPPAVLRVLFPSLYVAIVIAAASADAVAHGQQPYAFTRHGIAMVLRELIFVTTGVDDGVPWVASAAARAIAGRVSADVEVTQVNAPGAGAMGPGAGTQSGAAVADLEGVVNALGTLYPDEGAVPPGTVRIDRVVASDGAVSWLVLVPGTQGEIVGSNPLNWSGNPAAMVGEMTAATALVVQAMKQAGIKPGEPVMIAGHSQGGLVAMNAANAVAEDLDIAGVACFGSPNGLLEGPEGTEVLEVEHIEDPVPGLDDTANLPTEDRTIVERVLSDSIDPAIAAGDDWEDSHGTPTYADTAALIDASDDAAIHDFFANASAVLDEGATSESAYYQGVRVP